MFPKCLCVLWLGSLLAGSPAAALPVTVAANALDGGVNVAPGAALTVFFETASPIPPDPSRVTVKIRSRNFDFALPVPIIEFGRVQAWGVVPAGMVLGPAEVQLVVDDVESVPSLINVLAAAPVLLGSFDGLAVAQNVLGSDAVSRIRLTNPARPGQYVTLWATGLGRHRTADVSVELAGRLIPAQFAGPAPDSPGFDQINFRVPDDVFPGCYVPVRIYAGKYSSATSTISTASAAGACPHPFNLTQEQLSTLDAGGSIRMGRISAVRSRFFGTYFESASADFSPHNASAVRGLSPVQQPGGVRSGCSARRYLAGLPAAVMPGDFSGGTSRGSNAPAGPSLTFSGPGQTALIAKASFGDSYQSQSAGQLLPLPSSTLTAPFFTQGEWTVSAPGGPTLGAFQQNFRVPPPLRVRNRDGLREIRRDADLEISWEPAGYSEPDWVHVALVARPIGIQIPRDGAADGIDCFVPARGGGIVIRRDLMEQLAQPPIPVANPVIPDRFLDPPALTFTMVPRDPMESVFSVPLSAGGSIPAVLYYSLDSESISITIR